MTDDLPPFDQIVPDKLSLARRVAVEVYERRVGGEVISDEQIAADHASLLPELFHEMKSVQLVTDSIRLAERAGPLTGKVNTPPERDLDLPIIESDAIVDTPANTHPLLAGYKIKCRIGQGGQATVYRALQEATGQVVAIKIITGGPWLDANHRRRFDRETAIMASLEHPHLVKIIDRGRTADGAFFIAMEHVSGCSLDEFAATCAAEKTPGVERLLETLAKVARAIAAAHAAGVIHRDLKPSNIRVDRHGEPRVLDFGLATAAEEVHDITMTGAWIGSIPWCSPEQAIQSQHVSNIQTDVYAFGIVVYQCLAGRFPYEVIGAVKDVLHRVAHARPLPLVDRAGRHYGRRLERVVNRALAKRPANRSPDAAQLASDLERVARDQLIYRRFWVPRWLAATFALAALIFVAHGAIRPSSVTHSSLPFKVNSIGMRLYEIPPGRFEMGSPPNEPGRFPNEDQHEVTIPSAFWMSSTEVTEEQFATVMGKPPPDGKHAQFPAIVTSLSEAKRFCERLSALEHHEYRLPTSTEWEYACRSGGPSASPRPLDKFAWFAGNSNRTLHPVATLMPNEFGLFDMHGNASEWCADRDGSVELRGGGIDSTPSKCRSAYFSSYPVLGQVAGVRVLVPLGQSSQLASN